MQTFAQPTVALIGGLGTPELLIICFVVLLLFGAKKLPELARGFGKAVNEFKKASSEVEHEVKTSIQNADKPAVPPTKPDAPQKN